MISQNQKLGKNIIIPVEIQNREMVAKLYLGVVAASHGYNVVVGDQKEIVRGIYKFPPSLYLDKSVAKTKCRYFQKLKRMGHNPIALCEEGLVYRDKKRYLRERIDRKSMNHVSCFFCWGMQQKNDIEENCNDIRKLKIVGNPRFDLLRHEFRSLWEQDSRLLREKYGRFILVNTNFSRANRIAGTDDVIQLLKKRGTLDPDGGKEYYKGLVHHLTKIFNEFFIAIPEIAKKFPSHTIIVRPHPGENLASYKEIEEANSNVQIHNEGSAITWLLASECVIHNSCTTGVEGWVLDRPVISYMPEKNDTYDSFLPNELSYKCDDLSKLIDTINEVIRSGSELRKSAALNELAEKYIFGVNGPMAGDSLIDELPHLQLEGSWLARLYEQGYFFSKRHLRMIPGFKLPKGLAALAQQKFPGTHISELVDFINRIRKCRPDLDNIYLTETNGLKNVFNLTPKGR